MDRGPVNAALTLPSIGDLVDGRFRIERKLGEGGTSTVYEVSHVITDKRFAIKWLLPELALDDGAVDRFIHEARVGGKFAHPHAVQVYDICKANDSFYMLMELLEGESLLARLDRAGRLSVQESCRIVVACGEVLAAAHRKGIIHRDLKPANIFLCRPQDAANEMDVPKLLDFGISMICSDLHNLSLVSTPRGSVIGTPLYMSPEQMLGQHTDARSDIYALGAVLYELVSGQPPYQADSYGELVVKVTAAAAPPLEALLAVDRRFAEIVAKAMARQPDDRYASVEQLIADLKPLALPPPLEPVPAAPPTRSAVTATNVERAELAFLPPQAPEPAGPHAIEFTPAYGTQLGLPAQVLRRGPTAAGIAALCAIALGGTAWYRAASSSASVPEDRLRPRPVSAASAEEPTAALDPWNRGSEVLTGRAPPDDLPSPRARAARATGAVSKYATPAKKPQRVPAPATVTPVTASSSARAAAHVAEPAPPAKRVAQPAAREPQAPSTSSPVDQVQIRRSDFEGQPLGGPPAAHVSRKDF